MNTDNKNVSVKYNNIMFITNRYEDFTKFNPRISNKLMPLRVTGSDYDSSFNIFIEITLSHAKNNGWSDDVTNSLKTIIDNF